jgi:diaminopimelate decarboxylase
MEGCAISKIRHGYNRRLRDPVLPQVDALVADLRPSDPVLCLRPAAIAAAARRFVDAFPGDVLYAVKCNPEPRVLRALWAGGVRHFDCASLAEVKLVRALLRAARPYAARLCVTFHVGSQCLDPVSYTRALALAARVIAAAEVPVEIVDVGGGFPVSYPDMTPPPLDVFIKAIKRGATALPKGVQLWAEPGRALVAGGGSVVAQVQNRRGDALYVNDGIYGNLSDAGMLGFCFPARRIRLGESRDTPAEFGDFTLFGPTCDSADRMNGPFLLPADMREGDWIELGQLGAYGACLSSRFNGFGAAQLIEVADPPMLATP